MQKMDFIWRFKKKFEYRNLSITLYFSFENKTSPFTGKILLSLNLRSNYQMNHDYSN